jgi:Smg protein
MKEDILDILMYLFENYIDDDDNSPDLDLNQESLKVELMEAGFPGHEISRAFTWLEGLTEQDEDTLAVTQGNTAVRVYTAQECEKIDMESRGFLLFLEQVGVLDAVNRELIVDRAMALDMEEFNLEQLKWVILMVLFNQRGQEEIFAWMEDVVHNRMSLRLH